MRRWSLPLLALVLVLALTRGADAQPKDTLTIALPSHALTPKPGSPEVNSSRRLAFSAGDRPFQSALSQRSPCPV